LRALTWEEKAMTAETFAFVYGIFLFIAVMIASWIVIVNWRWRRAPGSKALMIQMIGEGIWAFCYALQLLDVVHPASEPYFWSKLMFVGVVMAPAAFLVWTARYTRRYGWVNNLAIGLLLIEPILFNVAIWTDQWHGLFSGNFIETGMLGIAFWLHTLYSYILLFIAGAMLLINWLRTQPALSANVITVFNLTSIPGLDLSPIGYLASGVTFTYAQLRQRLFDIMPIARHTVVEGMRDGGVMPDAPLEFAANRINEFRKSFSAIQIDAEGKSIRATFSAGVAGFPLHGSDEGSIIDAADHAMYAAKNSGRNRVIVALREFA